MKDRGIHPLKAFAHKLGAPLTHGSEYLPYANVGWASSPDKIPSVVR